MLCSRDRHSFVLIETVEDELLKNLTALIAASGFLVVAGCGNGEEFARAGTNGSHEPGAYDTVQPDMTTREPRSMDIVSEPPPTPLPDAVTGTIVQVTEQAGDFRTLTSALEAAGLKEMLQGPGPFTVFAPTDAAFDALGEGALEDLMRPANREKLVALLEYHVLPARITTGDVAKDVPSPATIQGGTLPLQATENGKVEAGGARIVTADIMASNGVVHIVDKVLMPPEI